LGLEVGTEGVGGGGVGEAELGEVGPYPVDVPGKIGFAGAVGLARLGHPEVYREGPARGGLELCDEGGDVVGVDDVRTERAEPAGVGHRGGQLHRRQPTPERPLDYRVVQREHLFEAAACP
jgi:hypothetical protein